MIFLVFFRPALPCSYEGLDCRPAWGEMKMGVYCADELNAVMHWPAGLYGCDALGLVGGGVKSSMPLLLLSCGCDVFAYYCNDGQLQEATPCTLGHKM